jgi:nucleolar MIF4G domain-containing protein 1
MIVRVKTSGSKGPSKMAAKLMKGSDSEGSDEDSDEEELAPMKEPYEDSEDDLDSEEEEDDEEEVDSDSEVEVKDHKTTANKEFRDEDEEADSSDDSSNDENVGESNSDGESESGDDDSEVVKPEPDHDLKDTYRPIAGQDIYGNVVDDDGVNEGAPKKYVPPHMRKKMEEDSDQDRQEKVRTIQRLLNNALNRLSEDSLISVSLGIAKIYPSHPTQMVHEALWTNTKNACVSIPILMTGMIPVYVACLVGVHVQTGDTVQLGEYLLEMVTLDLWKELTDARKKDCKSKQVEAVVDTKAKQACNLVLVLCYLYNYNIVHCSFLYDVIRNLIESFSELDVECLLLLLSHCGRSLRSDDPLALKEIVLMVQKKQSEQQNGSTQTYHRRVPTTWCLPSWI